MQIERKQLKRSLSEWNDDFDRKQDLRKDFKKKISSLVGCFQKINAFLVFSTCFHKTFYNKCCLDKIVGQIENDLER